MYEKLKRELQKLIKIGITLSKSGFFHIIASSTIIYIVNFMSAIFLPRVISSKAEYGLLVYVDNIRSYIVILSGIGLAHATLRYVSRTKDEASRKGVLKYTTHIGILMTLGIVLISICVFFLIDFPFTNARSYLMIMSFIPLLIFIMDNQQLFLRGSFQNKHYSLIAFIYTSLMVVLQISFGYLFGIMGVAAGRYLAILISIAIGYRIIKKNFDTKIEPIMPSEIEKKKIIKLGLILMLSNSTSILIQLNEVFMLGILLKDQNLLADYKVASYILVISTFFVQSIAMFIYPYFSKHSTDKIWIWRNYKKVIFYNSILILPLHLMLYIFAEPFLSIVFGNQYTSALPILRIFLIASLSQTLFRMISGNVLAAIGEEKYNLKINIFSIFIHLAVDYWAITTFGIYGAAVALAIVYFISGLLLVLHLIKVVKNATVTTEVTAKI